MTTLTLIDETTSGQVTPAVTLAVPELRLTVREIIRRRVLLEVELHNAALQGGAPGARFHGLVQPTDAEAALNGQLPQSGARRLVDADRQIQAAERAFERNGFLMFAGDRQVEDLDEVVELAGDTEVTFLKLIALVGG